MLNVNEVVPAIPAVTTTHAIAVEQAPSDVWVAHIVQPAGALKARLLPSFMQTTRRLPWVTPEATLTVKLGVVVAVPH
jgi:hypothetical protein